ncbi:hypothetical protein [Sphaerotilus microaerophilus]|uniref:Glycerate kinase n=1 Tax=Sphaerotilus microaerophilus TaxID=2914710 RepID=A0ABM7YS60_9BURK|nr:hypothetical protein [Sphaerotilus sp. FB-5]BDI07414.1 hypothetical protein CATMQ487_43840 [Sphaerotilus sp. FB-5]
MANKLTGQTFNMVLAGSALLIGWFFYGWQGVVVSVTIIAFWMVLQFNQATRVLRQAASQPKGQIDSIVRVQSRLAHGMTMAEVLRITGSLGVPTERRDEWLWRDAAGHEIAVTLRRNVVVRWAVARADESRFVEYPDESYDKAA